MPVCLRSAPRVRVGLTCHGDRGGLCFHLQTVTDFTIRRLKSNCRERTEVTLPLSSHSTGHHPPQAPLGLHQRRP